MKQNENMIISYMTLRSAIGALGIALGLLCVIGGLLFGNGQIETSISAYYGTNMRDLMVGVLMIAGSFLISYKGYDTMDNVLATIAGVSAIGIAIFPLAYFEPGNIFNIGEPLIKSLHYVTTAVFFTTLAVISYFQFTKTDQTNLSKDKRIRNIIYRVSGVVMVANLLLILAEKLFMPGALGSHFILVVEVIMLLAFGISWLVKGNAINPIKLT